jgi:hypothetical protein
MSDWDNQGKQGNHQNHGNQSSHQGSHDDIETGLPITELAELKEQPTDGFLARIRTGINRRLFAADTLDFSLMVFFRTMMEYLSATIQAFSGLGRQGGPRD